MKKMIAFFAILLFPSLALAGPIDGVWQRTDDGNRFVIIYQTGTTLIKVHVKHTGSLGGDWESTAVITPAPTSIALNIIYPETVQSAKGTKVQNVVFSSLTSATTTTSSCAASNPDPTWCVIGEVKSWTKLY